MQNAAASYYFEPGVDVDLLYPEWTFNCNWTTIISAATFLDVKIGYNWKKYEDMPSNGKDIPSHYDWWYGTYSGNYPEYNLSENSTLLGMAHFSHYVPQFILGTHDFKIGMEFRHFKNISCFLN